MASYHSADGPVPEEFNLSKYNGVLGQGYTDSNLVFLIDNTYLPEVNGLIQQYKEKKMVLGSSPQNSFLKQQYADYIATMSQVKSELTIIRNAAKGRIQYAVDHPQSVIGEGTDLGQVNLNFGSPKTDGGKGRNVGETVNVDLNLPKTQKASLTGNIIGTVLILGLVFGAIKFMK